MSLALTFRPNNLDEILGQYELVEVFKKFIAMQKLPHSLFFGVAGSGKTSFARAVAKDLASIFMNLMEEILNLRSFCAKWRSKQCFYVRLLQTHLACFCEF